MANRIGAKLNRTVQTLSLQSEASPSFVATSILVEGDEQLLISGIAAEYYLDNPAGAGINDETLLHLFVDHDSALSIEQTNQNFVNVLARRRVADLYFSDQLSDLTDFSGTDNYFKRLSFFFTSPVEFPNPGQYNFVFIHEINGGLNINGFAELKITVLGRKLKKGIEREFPYGYR